MALLAAVLPTAALAAPAYTTGNVNLRTGPGTQFAKIATVPAGALVDAGPCTSWCRVRFLGHSGWVSGSYITFGGFHRPPPPALGYYLAPRWDNRYGAWFDGRRWYYDGRWYSRPTFYFGFSFGM